MLRTGLKMEKLKSLNANESKIIVDRVIWFKKLIKGHEKLLEAIGRL